MLLLLKLPFFQEELRKYLSTCQLTLRVKHVSYPNRTDKHDF